MKLVLFFSCYIFILWRYMTINKVQKYLIYKNKPFNFENENKMKI